MPQVRFLEDRIVQDEHRHDPAKRTLFRAGEVYTLSDASLRHWLARAPLEILADEKPSPPVNRTLPPSVAVHEEAQKEQSASAPFPPPPAPLPTEEDKDMEEGPESKDASRSSRGKPKG